MLLPCLLGEWNTPSHTADKMAQRPKFVVTKRRSCLDMLLAVPWGYASVKALELSFCWMEVFGSTSSGSTWETSGVAFVTRIPFQRC